MQIKRVAQSLLVKHGIRGVSFADIADALEITRANIHYHFGNKDALIDEIVKGYVSDALERYIAIWTNPALSLAEKLEAVIELNRERYLIHNPADEGGSWSFFLRMRTDMDALSSKGNDILRDFSANLTMAVSQGFQDAIKCGTLIPATNVPDLTAQIVNIMSFGGLTTLDAGSFSGLEELYRAFLRTVMAAYGSVGDS